VTFTKETECLDHCVLKSVVLCIRNSSCRGNCESIHI